MQGNELLSKIEQAKLVGRGGAAFPVHLKWQRIKGLASPKKYVVCNASEGEIGVQKDFYILQNFAKKVIGGMRVTMDFLETKDAYLYINKNYYAKLKDQIDPLLELARNDGFLIDVFEEEPSYIGGETGALLNAIEGKKVQPRMESPSPSIVGIFDCPVLLHNVETLYDIYRVANEEYKPTRFSTILGVKHEGVYEVGINQSVAEVLKVTNNYPDFDFFVQVGGAASGEVISSAQAEEKLIGGCGSIEVYQKNLASKDFLDRIFNFYAKESCGKCTPCRDGSWQLKDFIQKIKSDDQIPWEQISKILLSMEKSSFCGLGKSVALPVRSYAKNILGMEI